MPHPIYYEQLPFHGVSFFQVLTGTLFHSIQTMIQQMREVSILDMFTDHLCTAWLPGFRELLVHHVTQWEMAPAKVEFMLSL